MATDLAEILADLRAEAARSPRSDPIAAADARTALARLRPALDRLRDDGLDTGASIDTDPDAFSRQADRVHWVRLLSVTCDTLGQSVSAAASPGRMTNLADAAAIAATLHVDTLTGGQRWAIVAALARTAHILTGAAAGGEHESPKASRALIIAEASSSVLFQFASLDPPTATDNAAQRRPVPNPAAQLTSVEAAALEASAALVHATRPGTGPHPLSDILAIVIAADTTCRFVERLQLGAGDDHFAAAAHDAARSWREVRGRLAPFNDGSRRPQNGRPPAVDHALTLHRALQTSGVAPNAGQPQEQPFEAVGLVLGRLATVATRLDAAVAEGVACGRFMAYAVDLPMREARVGPFLERRRAAGLVTIDSDDIAPVMSALHHAGTSTAALAAGGPARLGPGNSYRALPDPHGHSAPVDDVTALRRGGTPLAPMSVEPRTHLMIPREPTVRRR